MQLREIHIDGFGIFADTQITGLTSGINVIYGPNEFGKTTLLDFVRRILFGFPRSSASTNPYPPLRGGTYGGKLICELDGGDTISIHRTTGTHGGTVTINTDGHELSGQEELNGLLGHTTETFYENVYAISLNELQAIQTLEEEEIRNRIYGAGLGLGRLSLTGVNKELKGSGDLLYKPRGNTQEIPSLYGEIRQIEHEIREIQRGLVKYDDLVTQQGVLLEDVDNLDEKIRGFQSARRSLEHNKNLYDTYIDLDGAQSK